MTSINQNANPPYLAVLLQHLSIKWLPIYQTSSQMSISTAKKSICQTPPMANSLRTYPVPNCNPYQTNPRNRSKPSTNDKTLTPNHFPDKQKVTLTILVNFQTTINISCIFDKYTVENLIIVILFFSNQTLIITSSWIIWAAEMTYALVFQFKITWNANKLKSDKVEFLK